jgi:hypothetical protein
MTTSDNRARPACRSRRALTRADLARHVEGDYGSEGWGFESLRARSVETDDLGPRTAETLSGAFVVLNRESPNLTM